MIKSLKEIYMDGIIDYPNFEKKKKKKTLFIYIIIEILIQFIQGIFIYLAKQMNIKRNDNNNNQDKDNNYMV
jgi:phosphotransferase system  glucose/maltose/N-acetylglucosamine-specific IIC component